MSREQEYEALRMVNVRNAAFWAGVEARDRQLESMPPSQRLFFGDEEYWTRHVRSEQARKAGASEKGDPLTIAIRRIVEDDPNISEGELRNSLRIIVCSGHLNIIVNPPLFIRGLPDPGTDCHCQ